jgi:uncharacterized protein YndB with AHSA1/START domain
MSKLLITSAVINSSVNKAWSYITDPERLKFWLTGFKSYGYISGIKGEIGCISKLAFMENGREVVVTEEIMNIVPNKEIRIKMENDDFTIYTGFSFKELNGKTEITQTEEVKPKKFMMKLLIPLVSSHMKKKMNNELQNFKKYVESN